jgi:hypothetical protein
MSRMLFGSLVGSLAGVGLLAAAGSAQALPAGAPSTDELQDYLIVGNVQSSEGTAVDIQNTEIGADREFLSDGNSAPNTSGEGGPNTQDVFFQNGDRWPSDSAPPAPAAGVFEGIDWSGNVALTSPTGVFNMSDVDVYADIGINCASATEAACDGNVQNSYYFPDQVAGPGSPPGTALGANPNAGVNLFDPAALEAEMVAWEAYIVGLAADFTLTSNIENQNSKDGSGPFVLNLNALDTAGNSDGIAVIDIDVGNNDFLINNSDWILQGDDSVFAIFRLLGNSNFLMSNSSILLGDGGIGASFDTGDVTELGAIFYVDDQLGSGDTVFNLNNVILNGIALWDFTAVTANGVDHQQKTKLTMNNGQGCAQFISSIVDFDDVRWNRCSFGTTENGPGPDPEVDIPEPGTLTLFGAGLIGVALWLRRRRAAA